MIVIRTLRNRLDRGLFEAQRISYSTFQNLRLGAVKGPMAAAIVLLQNLTGSDRVVQGFSRLKVWRLKKFECYTGYNRF